MAAVHCRAADVPLVTAERPVGALGGTASRGAVTCRVAPAASCPTFWIVMPRSGSLKT